MFIFILSLTVGSFLSAFTYRLGTDLSIFKGRSICPKCKSKISWYDNIPLLSYFLLGGKCRNCHKKISVRYPLIESLTAIIFVLLYLFLQNIILSLSWLAPYPILLQLIVMFSVAAVLLAIFITDFESQLVYDDLIILAYCWVSLLIIFSGVRAYPYFLSGVLVADFFLFLNIITKGHGMGLGDVYLALLLGTALGGLSLIWLLLSFVSGALIGLLLIVFGKARFGRKIAFAPYMIFSFFAVILLNLGYELFWF